MCGAAVAVKPEAAMAPAAAPAPTAAQLADLLNEEPDDVLFEDMAVDLVRPRSDAQTHLLLRVGIPMHKKKFAGEDDGAGRAHDREGAGL